MRIHGSPRVSRRYGRASIGSPGAHGGLSGSLLEWCHWKCEDRTSSSTGPGQLRTITLSALGKSEFLIFDPFKATPETTPETTQGPSPVAPTNSAQGLFVSGVVLRRSKVRNSFFPVAGTVSITDNYPHTPGSQ